MRLWVCRNCFLTQYVYFSLPTKDLFDFFLNTVCQVNFSLNTGCLVNFFHSVFRLNFSLLQSVGETFPFYRMLTFFSIHDNFAIQKFAFWHLSFPKNLFDVSCLKNRFRYRFLKIDNSKRQLDSKDCVAFAFETLFIFFALHFSTIAIHVEKNSSFFRSLSFRITYLPFDDRFLFC